MNHEFNNAVRTLQEQFTNLEEENSRLRETNYRLLEDNIRLRSGRDLRNSNQDKYELAKAYISSLIGGFDVPPRSGYNLGHHWSKRTFQVQYSKVQEGNRWTWKQVFGLGENATYDQLILVGENKQTVAGAFGSGSHSYILFDVPRLAVGRLINPQGDIVVNVNPDTAKTSGAKLLYNKYRATPEALCRYARPAADHQE